MIRETHCVRVFLTDNCPDSIEDILHSEGSSLGPTFDKIQQEAMRYGGSFEDWEPTCCDYAFSSKEDAHNFIKTVSRKFKDQIALEYLPRCDEKDEKGMRVYKTLPSAADERIVALTPSRIDNLDVKLQVLDDPECLIEPPSTIKGYEKLAQTHRMVYANMKCKITGKIRSKPVLLRSGKLFAKPTIQKMFVTPEDFRLEMNRAKESGWDEADITYESIIRGIMIAEIKKTCVNGKEYPEIQFACDHVMVLVHDYQGSQFIGWFFYNENLDEVLNFTSYRA